jgi:NTP pyrophosphatase (non-canonical NTP hydrolase)
MNFNEYQVQALTTVISNDDDFKNTLHWVLGICGEAGEIAEKVKKILRDKNGVMNQADRDAIGKEIGDVLWYLAVLADAMGVKFEDIANVNLAKLKDRKLRGVLGGSGDNR